MSLTNFARMCETLEEQAPSVKEFTVSSNLNVFRKDKSLVVSILAVEYPVNNIAERKAIKWLAASFNVFEQEIKTMKKRWGDLGQGMYSFVRNDTPDCGISIKEFHRLLTLDCSNMQGTSFDIISEAIRRMSGLELKWFIRYWLRKPRNGMGGGSDGVLKKALVAHYMDKKVLDYAKYNSLSSIVTSLDNNEKPSLSLEYGKAVKPMLAKKYNGKSFTNAHYDIKYDGNRYIIHKIDGRVLIFNRAGKIVENGRFRDVVEIIQGWETENFIIDTEIYPVDAQGNPLEHQHMGKRVHSNDFEEAIRECPVKLVVFDMLMYSAKTLTDFSYKSRLTTLHKYIPKEYVAEKLESIEAGYNIAIGAGYEGIMIKNLDAPYDFKRSSNLLKHKPPRINLDVVVTSTMYGDGKRSSFFGSYGISVRDGNGGYIEVGKVGTGFSDEQLASLTTTLKKVVDTYDPDGTFHVLPRVVFEITADAVTTNANGTIGLRFPRLVRVRDDKAPAECNTLEDINELMQ